ncbi:biotin--protein ligase [Caerostris darwini]|uniref:Biotin--protein ligase n=1 Tax=Caerostris darwini TaxID=1538125 RepID=A0AAV4WTE2_9ARAC|nr:biotin--protein ligase [Caerostris darwini]
MSSDTVPTRPPNVLIYVGDKQENVFKNIAANLLRCLNTDKYVVYELKRSQVCKTPWKENVALLVVFVEEIETSIAEAFRDYIENEGKTIVFCSNFDHADSGLSYKKSSDVGLTKINYKNIKDVPVYRGKYCYNLQNGEELAVDCAGNSAVLKSIYKTGKLIVSSVHLALNPDFLLLNQSEEFQSNEENRLLILKDILTEELGLESKSITIPKPTPGYIIVDDDTLIPKLKSKINMNELSLGKLDKTFQLPELLDASTNIKVPLLFESEGSSALSFDKNSYFSKLKSNRFGRVVVFFPVITSTMIAAEQFSNHDNIVIVAGRQICGRGRSDNAWISPEGCAMFTLHFTLSLSSRLGQKMSILQHLGSLAVIHSIRKHQIYKQLNLRLKWPNDLYYENDKKIGGILVNTTIQGSVAHVYLGIGINVSNNQPTICINSVIQDHNSVTGDTIPLLKPEEVIASTLTELENLIDDFEKLGSDNFYSLYYSYWLHQNQLVTLSSIGKEVTIQGLDEYGFLIVQTADQRQLTLQPDGNRFDMMKNLIISKH